MCRPVADCAAGRWGAIPVDGNTQYVDQSYVGGASDGSETRPWTTIQAAVDAAGPGTLIAVTDGTYEQAVVIDKRLRLWGRCPDRVELTSPTSGAAVLLLSALASDSEIVGLSISGVRDGVLIRDAAGVTVQWVRVHDTGSAGISAARVLASPSVRVTESLVERATVAGIQVLGGELSVDRSTIRSTRPEGTTLAGSGLVAVNSDGGVPSAVELTGSVVQGHAHSGVVLEGTVASIEGSVVRDNNPLPSPLPAAAIAAVFDQPTATHGSLTLRSSVLERNGDVGVLVLGTDATLEHVSIRDTFGHPTDVDSGRGVLIQKAPGPANPRGNLDMFASIIERSDRVAVLNSGSDARLTGVLVRSTGARARGLQAQPQGGANRSVLGAIGCRVEASRELAVVAEGSSLALDGTLVTDTHPSQSGNFGRSVVVQDALSPDGEPVADGTLRCCVVDGSFEVGVHALASQLHIDASIVRLTSPRPSDGLYGDNTWFGPGVGGSDYRIANSHIADAARVGISIYDVTVALHETSLQCNRIHLEVGDPDGSGSPVDEGGNDCGCGTETVVCQAQSAEVAPPSPIELD